MDKEFVDHRLAFELKYLGFDEMTYTWSQNKGGMLGGFQGKLDNYNRKEDFIASRPSYQQAETFLLEKYKLYGIVMPTITMAWTFKTMTVVEKEVEVPPYSHVNARDYRTREEARHECLAELITIIKDETKQMRKEEIQKLDHVLTVGKLKKFLVDHNLPDNARVLIQRVEDIYYEKHNWKVYLKEGFNTQKDEHGNIIKETLDQYHPAFQCVRYIGDEDILFIDLHY